jgi:hypothetical protein
VRFSSIENQTIISVLPVGETANRLASSLDQYAMTEFTKDYLVGRRFAKNESEFLEPTPGRIFKSMFNQTIANLDAFQAEMDKLKIQPPQIHAVQKETVIKLKVVKHFIRN